MLLRLSFPLFLVLVPLAVSAGGPSQIRPGMVRIEGATFRPLYTQPGETTGQVEVFVIDTIAVSQRDFLAFAKRYSQWARGNVSERLANQRYLENAGTAPDRPATEVSWFAADAYCRARGARLPTTNEWEYVARASDRLRDASSDAQFKQRVLELAMSARPASSGWARVFAMSGACATSMAGLPSGPRITIASSVTRTPRTVATPSIPYLALPALRPMGTPPITPRSCVMPSAQLLTPA